VKADKTGELAIKGVTAGKNLPRLIRFAVKFS
jgi:hypothetical protein